MIIIRFMISENDHNFYSHFKNPDYETLVGV